MKVLNSKALDGNTWTDKNCYSVQLNTLVTWGSHYYRVICMDPVILTHTKKDLLIIRENNSWVEFKDQDIIDK